MADQISKVDLTDPVQMTAWEEGWNLAHEPAKCGHARANYKDPNFGTPEYRGDEKCEFCAALAAKIADAIDKLILIEGVALNNAPSVGGIAQGPWGTILSTTHQGLKTLKGTD